MEGGDLDNFKCKNYKERTNEQNLGILRKLTEVSFSSEKKKKKTLRIQKQQEKQKPDGLLKKREVNADWSNGEAVKKPKQVIVSNQVFDDPEE